MDLTPEQEARKKRLGASDVAAVMGLSRHRTKFGVYVEKKGLITPRPQTDIMKVGLLMEPVLDRAYRLRTGHPTNPVPEVWHKNLPYFAGHIDHLTRDGAIVVEYKTTGYYNTHLWGPDGSDEVPIDYACQVQAYMSLLNVDHSEILVAFLDESQRELLAQVEGELSDSQVAMLQQGLVTQLHPLARDRHFEAIMLRALQTFWVEHIEANIMPPLDGSEACSEYLELTYPHHDERLLEADGEASGLIATLLEEPEGALMKICKNRLRGMIGPHLGLRFDGGSVTWRSDKNGRRSLRITHHRKDG